MYIFMPSVYFSKFLWLHKSIIIELVVYLLMGIRYKLMDLYTSNDVILLKCFIYVIRFFSVIIFLNFRHRCFYEKLNLLETSDR